MSHHFLSLHASDLESSRWVSFTGGKPQPQWRQAIKCGGRKEEAGLREGKPTEIGIRQRGAGHDVRDGWVNHWSARTPPGASAAAMSVMTKSGATTTSRIQNSQLALNRTSRPPHSLLSRAHNPTESSDAVGRRHVSEASNRPLVAPAYHSSEASCLATSDQRSGQRQRMVSTTGIQSQRCCFAPAESPVFLETREWREVAEPLRHVRSPVRTHRRDGDARKVFGGFPLPHQPHLRRGLVRWPLLGSGYSQET